MGAFTWLTRGFLQGRWIFLEQCRTAHRPLPLAGAAQRHWNGNQRMRRPSRPGTRRLIPARRPTGTRRFPIRPTAWRQTICGNLRSAGRRRDYQDHTDAQPLDCHADCGREHIVRNRCGNRRQSASDVLDHAIEYLEHQRQSGQENQCWRWRVHAWQYKRHDQGDGFGCRNLFADDEHQRDLSASFAVPLAPAKAHPGVRPPAPAEAGEPIGRFAGPTAGHRGFLRASL